MTFGAMTAWQAWLLLAATAALAAWLFLLKLRPPRLFVSSLLIWRRVLDESRELTLWERIRRAVSLVVTVLIALALALAVARPSRGAATMASRGRLLIVMDSSWSMLARTRSGETRWDRAEAEARRLAAAASGDEVALATTADGLVEGPTRDLALIETGLDRLSPTGGDATSWPQLAGAGGVHFITDGARARPLDTAVVVHSVFEPAANVAITAFDVRPALANGQAGAAYLEIANFAPAPQQVRLTLTRGTTSIFDRRFDMAPGEALRQAMPIARGDDAVLRARIQAPANALDVDDEALAWIDPARPLSVTVVGQQTDWLRALLERDPDVRARYVDPSAYRPGPEDVVVFDRWAPRDPPERPALCFAPPLDTPWLAGTRQGEARPSASAIDEQRPRWDGAGSHRVVRGVDPFTLAIERARAYQSPTLVPVAHSARGTPLVYVEETPERRFVVVTFGAGESNLATAPGFPVLIGNSLDWLARPAARSTHSTHSTGSGQAGSGQAGSGQASLTGSQQGGASPASRPGLVSFDAGIATVTGPRGVSVPLARVNGAAIGALRTPGLYVVQGGGSRSTIAVNVGDPQVSNLMRTSSRAAGQTSPVIAGAAGRPWWMYCAMAAFALALAEWWTWQRRITV